MTRSAFTLRLPLNERLALESLSKIEGRPVNQLVNEAVKGYLSRQGQKERSLEESLARLREYREGDPDFSLAIDQFVAAESSLDDPVEGSAVEGQLIAGELTATGPAQRRIRELLRA